MNEKMSGDSWLVVELGAALLFLAALSFFVVPAYSKAADRVTEVIAIAFTSVISYKFGRSMPQQAGDPKPGQSSQTSVITKADPPPAPPPPVPTAPVKA
jgi:hypothetical protein